MYRPEFMRRALELSRRALDTPGAEPFGAVIVKDGQIVGEGFNQSLARFDPTSHGEIEAIRDACRNLKSVDLSPCQIYTSCEPCALCVAAMAIAGVSEMYYAASLDDAGAAFENLSAAERRPIDVAALRREAGSALGQRTLRARQAMAAEAIEILTAWADRGTAKP